MNQRQEYSDVMDPGHYGLYFYLNTINYDVHYLLPEMKGWNISIGVNGMEQINKNRGDEYLIPEYGQFDIGSFVYVKKDVGKFK